MGGRASGMGGDGRGWERMERRMDGWLVLSCLGRVMGHGSWVRCQVSDGGLGCERQWEREREWEWEGIGSGWVGLGREGEGRGGQGSLAWGWRAGGRW